MEHAETLEKNAFQSGYHRNNDYSHFFVNTDTSLQINTSIGFSYRDDFGDNAIAARFFDEDHLAGIWRPWFNIDSEH